MYRPDPRVQVWALAPWATDVLQAVPQVMSGQEARGPVLVASAVLLVPLVPVRYLRYAYPGLVLSLRPARLAHVAAMG